MKKLFLTIIFASAIGFIAPVANAQMMGNSFNSLADLDDTAEHTLLGEQEGKELWDKLQAQELICEDLSDEDFHALGMYFMGLMVGDSHEAMDAMMERMMGEEGEEQIHVVMGKRLSGCDTSAVMPTSGTEFMPVMQMMWGGWSSPFGFNSTNNMMGFGTFGFFGWVFMLLWWALIIAGIVALVRWIVGQSGKDTRENKKSPLDILKDRYARGEIDKKEFEDKKRDLV